MGVGDLIGAGIFADVAAGADLGAQADAVSAIAIKWATVATTGALGLAAYAISADS